MAKKKNSLQNLKASAWQKFIAENEMNGETIVNAFDIAFPEEADKSDATKRAIVANFKKSYQYLEIKQATQSGIENILEAKAMVAAEKMLDTYSDLLDAGNDMIRNSKGEDKLNAMREQRENLKVGNPINVISKSADSQRNYKREKNSIKADAVID